MMFDFPLEVLRDWYLRLVLLQLLVRFPVGHSSFYQCPTMCKCEAAQKEPPGVYVDCTAKNLTRVPPGLGPDTIKLGLSMNNISQLPDRAFSHLPRLELLLLSHNRIRSVEPRAFDGLPVLYLLEISNNELTEIPKGIDALPDLVDLEIANNRISTIADSLFRSNRRLEFLKLNDNPLQTVGSGAFSGMPHLRQLELSEVRGISEFPNLTGSAGLKKVILDRASIGRLPENLCEHVPLLNVFDVHANFIRDIPPMTGCSELTQLNFGNNDISSIENRPFDGLQALKDLILSNNKITYISAEAFASLVSLEYLDLSYNKIGHINTEAFANLNSLIDLNLAENQFPTLPTAGLQKLQYLKTYHNRYLETPPSAEAIPNILHIVAAYAYHCCAFRRVQQEQVYRKDFMLDQTVTWLRDPNGSALWPETNNLSDPNFPLYLDYEDEDDALFNDSLLPNETAFSTSIDTEIRVKPVVECSPEPDPFQPCDDLFGWWSLRCGIWIVFLLAVIGNGTVLFVSLFSKSKMDVTRFLICNLAFSDLCMGVYLGFLAIVDASTLGEFEKYAVRWQSSGGCLVAGFLGVFSSELSVFTLVVITVERFYAISHAMQLGKRVRLGHAAVLMSSGWIFCICIASLPLFEISDFRKFAICLPFETESQISLGYVCFIMIFNAISFVVILVCYAYMFMSIRAAHSWNAKDTVVAKRMALLVFTDFFCWAPIIFFSVTAAFGWTAAGISLDEAKVLTIFVLPLNSCANPFLYAFFTRQFKRDCVKLCKRIEESSYSRHASSSGNGRSSALLNRQQRTNTCVRQQRGCNDKANIASTSGEASTSSNNASDDSDLTLRKVRLTAEEKQIVRYVRSPDMSLKLQPLQLRENASQQLKTGQPSTPRNTSQKNAQSPKENPVEEDQDSWPDIIVHTKEGNAFLKTTADDAPSKSLRRRVCGSSKSGYSECLETSARCAGRLCNHTLVTLHHQKVSLPSRSVESQTEEVKAAVVKPATIIPSVHDNLLCEEKIHVRKKFEADRSKEIGLNATHFVKSKGEQSNLIKCDNTVSHADATTQTDKHVLPLIPQLKGLHRATAKQEKDRHIIEWRKTSQLSFLWKHSGTFDVMCPKQKSNSLVELTRPVSVEATTSTKRHSLTSKQEGYILLKNSSRDSAYEDDDQYVFYDHKPTSVKNQADNRRKQRNDMLYKNAVYRDNEDSSMAVPGSGAGQEGECETSLCIPQHRNSCDIESGISSSS
ncbi:lutropin-choriogonadotropic hormone receptor-like [Dreissena polymorpha]|uniref:lutropin-choriogonadotropic hormone receptor-like n=1 Tax=Dreissena polymorpha TaxID=45954 RepID=UPI00226452CA|nr:lutropin-choriogonadotropic hormone receptor-like [Dreissena polymorpha]